MPKEFCGTPPVGPNPKASELRPIWRRVIGKQVQFVSPETILELAQVPPATIRFVLDGYRTVAPQLLRELPEARIAWDQIASLLGDAGEGLLRRRLDDLREFLQGASRFW